MSKSTWGLDCLNLFGAASCQLSALHHQINRNSPTSSSEHRDPKHVKLKLDRWLKKMWAPIRDPKNVTPSSTDVKGSFWNWKFWVVHHAIKKSTNCPALPRLQAAMGVATPWLLHIFLGIVAASWVETINQAGMQSLGTTQGRGSSIWNTPVIYIFIIDIEWYRWVLIYIYIWYGFYLGHISLDSILVCEFFLFKNRFYILALYWVLRRRLTTNWLAHG